MSAGARQAAVGLALIRRNRMAKITMPSPAQRYLLLAQAPLQLHEVLGELDDATVLEAIGPPDAPHTAVVSMTSAQAANLAQRFQNLKIEPDQPLTLSGDRRRRSGDKKGTRMPKNPESGAQDSPDLPPARPNGGPSSLSSPSSTPGAAGRHANADLAPQSTEPTGAPGLGATGVGSSGVGSTGVGLTNARSTGSGSTGVGSTGVGLAGSSSTSTSAMGNGSAWAGSSSATGAGASAPGSSGAGSSGAGSSGSGSSGSGDSRARTGTGSAGRAVSRRNGQFLVAARQTEGLQAFGLMPLQFNVLEQTLRASPDVEVVDTVGAKSGVGALGAGMSGDAASVLVARMPEQKAVLLQQQAAGRLIVERDQHLSLSDPAFRFPGLVSGSLPASGPAMEVTVVVLGKDGAPVAGAEVYLFGSLLPAHGVTDASGTTRLSLIGETVQSIQALYVKPRADYWSFHQHQPDITTDEPNVVGLRALSEWQGLANFPQQQALGWGQKAMRLDSLPPMYRGQGIKVAVIDSGAAITHTDLNQIHFGFDVINKKTNPGGWTEDSVAHGSHCAGVIAGADNGRGVRGFAPDAEVHVCKLFPGGQISQLIDALEYCIEKQIDVVNLSLGGAEPSEALEQQIQRARRAGVACIVAAGNSGGPVQYPASSPNVLAVSAIGKMNEFPDDSYHTQTVTNPVDQNGFFSAKFSCYGPQIAVCGPGVAITSSVPSNNYAVWDGTSMAAPHITGLAALVLAHHPDFQSSFRMRSAERVERLFQLIKMSARPINLGDPNRTGLGLPDVLVALGIQPRAIAFGLPDARAVGGMGSGTIGGMIGGIGSGIGSGTIGGMGGIGRGAVPMQPLSMDMGQRHWTISPWAQAALLSGALDPGYANLMFNLGLQPHGLLSQMPINLQNYPFGMANAGYGGVW